VHYGFRLWLVILVGWQRIVRSYVKWKLKLMFTVGGEIQRIKLRFTGVTDVSNWKIQAVHLQDRTTKILTAGGTNKTGT
jgi:hypothetical protein